MDTFIKRFQPDQYQKWLDGDDTSCHPEDANQSSSDM